ncbi:MAG: hypothetical protein SWQ30_14520 [Thermodesulfobacteriota bacterium]|nr:hypothetical protein [Thermodesulfobacteriota bacterium]
MPTAVRHKEKTLSLGFKEERKNVPGTAFRLRCLIFMISLGLGSSFVSVTAYGALCTGPINSLGESSGMYWWGDGEINLHTEWSVHNVEGGDAWFYGSSYSWSSVDVYVYKSLTDPAALHDVTVFPYTNAVALAGPGDTVFFRGDNGYYGAWRVDDISYKAWESQEIHTSWDFFEIDPLRGLPGIHLKGLWYFQDDGTGNFSVHSPIPGTMWLLGFGLVGLAALKRRLGG